MMACIHYLGETNKFFLANLKMKSMSTKQLKLNQYHDQLLDYLFAINCLQVNLKDFLIYLYVIRIFLVENLKSYLTKVVSKFLKLFKGSRI